MFLTECSFFKKFSLLRTLLVYFIFRAIHPDQLAEKVFKNWDADQNGCISFAEFAYIIFLMTKAPKEVKLRHIFNILDIDGSGTLSAQEVVQAVKNAHNILGDLNFDYNSKGIQVFRAMDSDGDLRINQEEFVQACLKDENLGDLMEKLMSSPELFQ